MHRREQRASLFWLWGLAPLLLATALVAPGLDCIAFHGDEVKSMIDGAGAITFRAAVPGGNPQPPRPGTGAGLARAALPVGARRRL